MNIVIQVWTFINIDFQINKHLLNYPVILVFFFAEIRQHLRKDYKINKLNHQLNSSNNNTSSHDNFNDRKINLHSLMGTSGALTSPIASICTTTTSIMPTNTQTNTTCRKMSYHSRRSLSPVSPSPPPSLCSNHWFKYSLNLICFYAKTPNCAINN